MSTRPHPSSALLTLVLLCAVWALAASGQAQERGLDIDGRQPVSGHYYALVIGNNAYQNIKRLKTAEDDAREVDATLRTRYGFQTKLLLNATRQQIISALNTYRRELDSDASLVIYYAGHGVNDREADKAYWLPVDARLDDTTNWISADDITTNIKVIPAKHVLIISDSCYSGTLTRAAEPSVSEPVMRQRYLQKMMLGRSRTLMASGGNEPVADEGGNGHSIFASALLRGLAQIDKVQFTAAELFRDFVEESVAGRASQTPEYNPLRNSGHEAGDFVFVRKGAAEQSVTVINNTTVNAVPSAPQIDPTTLELAFWDTIKNSRDPEDFQAYLRKYPHGQFEELARRRATPPAAPQPLHANPEPEAASEVRHAWSTSAVNTLKQSLNNWGPKAHISFQQDAQQPWVFNGILSEGLLQTDSIIVKVSLDEKNSVNLRFYPQVSGHYLNVNTAADKLGLMRTLMNQNNSNFLFWVVDAAGNIAYGFNIALDSGFPEKVVDVVLRSAVNSDKFVGDLKPYLYGR